jgi:hypothetical protein
LETAIESNAPEIAELPDGVVETINGIIAQARAELAKPTEIAKPSMKA